MPARNGSLSNHYAKAPQFLILNDETNQQTWIDIPDTSSQCGKKKIFMKIFEEYHVDAVIVRQIGESMLNSLFERQIQVFTTPHGQELASLDISTLSAISDLSYAKSSPNKQKKGKGCHHEGDHGERGWTFTPN
ncbi:NifB/NifX family molybdenum-iron cluster-binding protein [Vibrio sp. PP-XX7]